MLLYLTYWLHSFSKDHGTSHLKKNKALPSILKVPIKNGIFSFIVSSNNRSGNSGSCYFCLCLFCFCNGMSCNKDCKQQNSTLLSEAALEALAPLAWWSFHPTLKKCFPSGEYLATGTLSPLGSFSLKVPYSCQFIINTFSGKRNNWDLGLGKEGKL